MTRTGLSPSRSSADDTLDRRTPIYELGAWTAGLASFLSGGGLKFGDKGTVRAVDDRIRDLQIAYGTMQRCSNIAFRLLAGTADDDLAQFGLTREDIESYSASVREALLVTASIARAERMPLIEWQAWCRATLARFESEPSFLKLAAVADNNGAEFLPERLRDLAGVRTAGLRGELEGILPRFGRILRMLDIVGKMLEFDEPLKPALVIFSKVSEQSQDLIRILDQHVARSAGADDEFVGTLDGASYTASIELKKVVNQELAGLATIRPATTVYAKTEAAHAMLSDSFQHILTGFARQMDPEIDAFDLFPNFSEKLERSDVLRRDLFVILKLTQAAEKDPQKGRLTALNDRLVRFMEKTLGYLIYKDTETFERFVEEILVTRQKKDLVPILHRFGAYLETLFAQVNMRAVLEKRPFVPPAE